MNSGEFYKHGGMPYPWLSVGLDQLQIKIEPQTPLDYTVGNY